MRTRLVLAVSILLTACGQGSPGDQTGEAAADIGPRHTFPDQEVTRVWNDMMDVIAPERGWERSRYLEFDWAVHRGDAEPAVRSHRWDRWGGEARVETATDDGTMVAIFNTGDPTSGRVWIGGEELTGEEAATQLSRAHSIHINDSYWLLMPFKWPDPGVNARYLGEEEDEDGRRWEVVELSFEGETGLTPQNMYRAFVNPETKRMERWHFLSNRDANPSPADWVDWERVGPIQLSPMRLAGGEPRIFFPHLRVETDVPAGAFDPPTD